MVANQWIIIRVSQNTMDVIHGYQLTYCSYSWLSKIPWMLIMVNHGSYSFIVVSGGNLLNNFLAQILHQNYYKLPLFSIK